MITHKRTDASRTDGADDFQTCSCAVKIKRATIESCHQAIFHFGFLIDQALMRSVFRFEYCLSTALRQILTTITFMVVCLIAATAAQAQYRFDVWTTDNGLPQNSVYS